MTAGRSVKSVVLALAALVCAAVALVAASASAAGGTELAVAYQVDPAHDGVQTGDALKPPFTQRWSVTLPDAVSYPLVAEGKIFVTVKSAGVYALDRTDGHVVWSQPLGGTYGWGAAAYDAGRIFAVNFDGLLSAFAADTGALVWSTRLPGQYAFSAPPTAVGGVVYVGGAGSGGTLYAVDESNGQVLATRPVENGDTSSPTLGGGDVFVSYACNQTYGFTTGALSPVWHTSGPCEGGGGNTTVYANGRVFTRDYFGNEIHDAATGSLLGTYGALHGSPPIPAVDGDTMWLLDQGTLTRRDVPSGTVSWSFAGDGQLDTAPLVLVSGSGRYVVEGSASGMLYVVDAASNTVAWSTNVGAAIPAAGEYGLTQRPNPGAGQGMLVVPAGNRLVAYANDATAPVLTLPPYVSTRATSANGAVVTYAATATDPDDAATVTCAPASGSLFPVGSTRVGCTATDTVGNSSTGSFYVVVSAPNADCTLGDYPRPKGVYNLKNANLSGCYLPGAALAKSSATGANLTGTYLAGGSLAGADLSKAILRRAILVNANLSSAKLTSADLTGALLTGANVTGVTWSQAICPDGTAASSHGNTCAGHF